jgi:hypothetical protein
MFAQAFARALFPYLSSPECVEGDAANFAMPEFSEVRRLHVQSRSSKRDVLGIPVSSYKRSYFTP